MELHSANVTPNSNYPNQFDFIVNIKESLNTFFRAIFGDVRRVFWGGECFWRNCFITIDTQWFEYDLYYCFDIVALLIGSFA